MTKQSESTPPEPPAQDATLSQEEPDKYTDEWYDSVEKRFKDVGDYLASLGGSHEQSPAATPTTPNEGQPAPGSEAAHQHLGTGTARDTKPPKPSHIWFRRLGE